MSATMTAPEQIDGLEKLITLASLRKDDIIATQTEVRKQLQLTQEEQGKVAEAKSYIAKYASLAADLQRREDELAAKQIALNEAKSDFDKYTASENARLEKFAAELTARESGHSEVMQRLANQEGELKAAIAEHERQNKEVVESNAAATSANARDKAANVSEAERLKEWENLLKAKALRLRNEAASF